MDLNSPTADRTQRGASSEQAAAHPNPFDDHNEGSSRKRLRTSGSPSPNAPLSTSDNEEVAQDFNVRERSNNPPATPPNESKRSSPDAMARTDSSPTQPATQNTPSKVTLNLRNASRLSPSHEKSPRNQACDQDEPRPSVEGSKKVEEDPMRQARLETPPTTSSSRSPLLHGASDNHSNENDDEDDAMLYGGGNSDHSASEGDVTQIDPSISFPFTETGAAPRHTVSKLTDYFHTQPNLDPSILQELTDWVLNFLKNAKQLDGVILHNSLHVHRDFWFTFPSIMTGITLHKPPLFLSEPLHLELMRFCRAFTSLTSWFLQIESELLASSINDHQQPDQQHVVLPLLSYTFLYRCHDLILHEEAMLTSPRYRQLIADRLHRPNMLVSRPLSSSKAGFDHLLEHLNRLIKKTPTLPKLFGDLAPVCQLLCDNLRVSSQLITTDEGLTDLASRQMKAFAAWQQVAGLFRETIEKHIAHITKDVASNTIHALCDLYRVCIEHGHDQVDVLLQDFHDKHPSLSPDEARQFIPWQWKNEVLEKLIRSSQMQLRVYAITAMCTGLVQTWKAYQPQGDSPAPQLIREVSDWLWESHLIEYLTGPNCHPEITTEGANVVGFLVAAGHIRDEDVDRLWQGAISTESPRLAEALRKVLLTILNLFDLAGLEDLCRRCLKLPLASLSGPLRQIWEAVIEYLMNKPSAQDCLTIQPSRLCLRILREASAPMKGNQVVEPELFDLSAQKLHQLLSRGLVTDSHAELRQICIDDISSKSATTLGSLYGLLKVMELVRSADEPSVIEAEDFVRLVIEELAHAIQQSQEMEGLLVFHGSLKLPRREALTLVMSSDCPVLHGDAGERLWNLLVNQPTLQDNDKAGAWQLLKNLVQKVDSNHVFLQACCSQYLPSLPAEAFCNGMLHFMQHQLQLTICNQKDFMLDDESQVSQSIIPEVWRVILTARDPQLAEYAMRTLAIGVYLDSPLIASYPSSRLRKVHISLVNKCLEQMRRASRVMTSGSEEATDEGDEPMVLVSTKAHLSAQEQMFSRSLQLLRVFLEAYQDRPRFALPDLRALMSTAPVTVAGDLTLLKFQSFDENSQTEMRQLEIGRRNSAADMLAGIRRETGFDNYRLYFRGRPLHLTEQEICKSLEELNLEAGLILVKRETDSPFPSVGIKPGSSPLEIDILSHFEELWAYLSLQESLALGIFEFLKRLPTDERIRNTFYNTNTSYEDVFPPGQPFKSLYALHVLTQAAADEKRERLSDTTAEDSAMSTKSLAHPIILLIGAISDIDVNTEDSDQLNLYLLSNLMSTLYILLRDTVSFKDPHVDHIKERMSAEKLLFVLSVGMEGRTQQDITLSLSTLAVILRFSLVDEQLREQVAHDPRFATSIKHLLLSEQWQSPHRDKVAHVFGDTLSAEDSLTEQSGVADEQRTSLLTHQLLTVCLDILEKPVQYPMDSTAFFDLLQTLLLRAHKASSGSVNLCHIGSVAAELLLCHVPSETIDQAEPHDSVVAGLASLMLTCLKVAADGSVASALSGQTAHEILSHLLFPNLPDEYEGASNRVVLNTATRSTLCEVIIRLIAGKDDRIALITEDLNSLVPYDQDEVDPYSYELPYSFDRHQAIRAQCGYVGLRNLSNTCYLNSLLTQLYMNVGFRRFMTSRVPRDPLGRDQLLFETQKLFSFMQESCRRFYDPEVLVDSIRTYDDTAIDIHNQMDVEEFYSLIFDRWEAQIGTASDKKKLRSFFGGQLVQQIKSRECQHISEHLEPFSAIQCDIKGKSTLEESLQAYVDGEIMEGENKYKCSTCDRHVDAVKRACLKDLPDNLIFHLKRFDFNLRTLQRSKINDHFAFPSIIDMTPFTVEYLSGEADTEADTFELVGVLVHSGTAETGHYYSYIRERGSERDSKQWVEFNDETVTPWDPSLMESCTFGGPDRRSMYDNNGLLYDKSYSAYMLFYERTSVLQAEPERLDGGQIDIPPKVDIPQGMKDFILKENVNLLRRHCLFDPSHAPFVQSCLSQALTLCRQAERNGNSDDAGLLRLRVTSLDAAISHLDQVVSRAKDCPTTRDFTDLLENAISESADTAIGFYRYFYARPESFRALVQRNIDADIRSTVSRMLISAAHKIIEVHPYQYYGLPDPRDLAGDEDDDLTPFDLRGFVIQGMMHIVDYLWASFQTSLRSWDEVFGFILNFAMLGDLETGHLLSRNYLVKLAQIIAADAELQMSPNYKRMMVNIVRRGSLRPPSYGAIVETIAHLLKSLESDFTSDFVEDAEGRLDPGEPPFPWTAEEVNLLHFHPEDQTSSLFAEKLILIDQAHKATNEVIGRLVQLSPQMESKIFNTLKKGLCGYPALKSLEPYLRAAETFLRNTESEDHVNDLVIFVADQARQLTGAEAHLFLKFWKTAMSLAAEQVDTVASTAYTASTRVIPAWAPYLLVHSHDTVAAATQAFLSTYILEANPGSPDGVDVEPGMDKQALIAKIGRNVAYQCLNYLNAVHVQRRAPIRKSAAESLVKVVNGCAKFFSQEVVSNTDVSDVDDDIDEDDEFDFERSRQVVIESVAHLTVDVVHEDGSDTDWNGSCASSDRLPDDTEIEMQGITELNDGNMT